MLIGNQCERERAIQPILDLHLLVEFVGVRREARAAGDPEGDHLVLDIFMESAGSRDAIRLPDGVLRHQHPGPTVGTAVALS